MAKRIEKKEKFYRLEIAERKADGKWKWRKDIVDTFRKNYYQKKQQDRYFTAGNKMYVWCVNLDYLMDLVNAGLKVAGTHYVLALSMAGGVNGKEFRKLYKALKNKAYHDYYIARYHMYKLEKYIKMYALACGVWDDGVKWRPPHFGEVELKTLQDYFSQDSSNFIIVDDVVYYLRPYSTAVENLCQRCVEIAGGEHALAVAISRDSKERARHFKAIERRSFKHKRNIEYYGRLFERFLSCNAPLPQFEEKIAV